jgi:hypothetical protein
MPLQATSGAASYDAFGGGVAAVPQYIEDVFSTWLYTGNGSTQTITNGIDLAGKGGLVWIKDRVGTYSHNLVDSARGTNNYLFSDLTSAQFDAGSLRVSSFNADGFSLGSGSNGTNRSGNGHASWTFRKQPKFFDVVTYTGNGAASRAISHSLGSAPAMMIVKQTDGTRNWPVYHRSVPTGTGYLNLTSAFATGSGNGVWGDSSYNNIAPTSTVFYVGSDPEVNGNGLTYVAYLFAHNAGGFGLTGTDNVISCGSFTDPASGSTTEVTLGYEPQWLLVKPNLATTDWYLIDNMRGMVRGSATKVLYPNQSSAEDNGFSNGYYQPTATGFTAGNTVTGGGGTQCIYIAIRRGPMKVPTDATKVFTPIANTVSADNQSVSTGFPVDLVISKLRTLGIADSVFDRLRGSSATSGALLVTSSTGAEGALTTNGMGLDNNTGYVDNFNYWNTGGSYTYGNWAFRRAPSFFDEVCYNGFYNGGAPRDITHNLGVIPELIIVKCRSTTSTNWVSCTKNGSANSVMLVNSTAAAGTINGAGYPSVVDSTSTTFQVREYANMNDVNESGRTYVAYLFATCAGVSKVGSYIGSDSTLNIDCGFTSGARFVMIKRTDASSDWYVWDSARGITSGNDPRLSLNTTAAEVTDMNMINTYSAGFSVPAGGPNTGDGATFIYLAIA